MKLVRFVRVGLLTACALPLAAITAAEFTALAVRSSGDPAAVEGRLEQAGAEARQASAAAEAALRIAASAGLRSAAPPTEPPATDDAQAVGMTGWIADWALARQAEELASAVLALGRMVELPDKAEVERAAAQCQRVRSLYSETPPPGGNAMLELVEAWSMLLAARQCYYDGQRGKAAELCRNLLQKHGKILDPALVEKVRRLEELSQSTRTR